ncbi:acyclic terpene utilization AtuA family protein [Aurantimonas aggregata]|uniref:Acyclic terpene utilization AtuA family protein n=1 Tax=Aurantimonas aggregata TaxID=2047720 RepID=A0A6L9MPA9_9HYPH|nr:acyclic terpene utilization AtuA family protein [Aurantimonas aggregata]
MYRIGCGAGFSGDRIDAAIPVVRDLVEAGQGGALIFETLGERTLAAGHVARREDPTLGCDPLLHRFLRPVLKDCLDNSIVIVGNFGAANPRAAAELIQRMAAEIGVCAIRIAIVEGDDLGPSVDLGSLHLWEGDRAASIDGREIVSANVYIGAQAIAEAISEGAQVVVTGRVADPALVLGPLVAHFCWDWSDLDRIAAGTLAGHLLECGSQVSGGYFADPGYKDVPRPEAIGYPIAEVEQDGTFIVTKPRGTGGVVDLRTVKEQLLYEIHDPAAYRTPDVVLDLTDVALDIVGQDRVRVSGARGHPRPEMLKATIGVSGDWLGEAEISYAGPNALARGRLAADIVARRLDLRGIRLHRRLDLIGAASVFADDAGRWRGDAHAEEPQDVRLRLAVRGLDRSLVEDALQEVLALYCAGPAGGGGVRSRIEKRINTVSYMVPRNAVCTGYRMLEGATG